MSRRKLARAATALLCFAFCTAAQQASRAHANGSKPSDDFQIAKQTGAATSAVFEFDLSGFSYRIASNGRGQRTKEGKTRLFNLPIGGDDNLARIYFSEYAGDLLLVCEVTDKAAGTGLVVRIEQPSMRAIWKQKVPAPGVGEPLRAGRSLYLTGTGFVAKLDLATGAYVWDNDKLNGRGGKEAFKMFAAPQLNGKEILFKEAPGSNAAAKTIVVYEKTGKIIRIE